eukprot:PhF_6_TR10784/c0_g1_i1/m.17329
MRQSSTPAPHHKKANVHGVPNHGDIVTFSSTPKPSTAITRVTKKPNPKVSTSIFHLHHEVVGGRSTVPPTTELDFGSAAAIIRQKQKSAHLEFHEKVVHDVNAAGACGAVPTHPMHKKLFAASALESHVHLGDGVVTTTATTTTSTRNSSPTIPMSKRRVASPQPTSTPRTTSPGKRRTEFSHFLHASTDNPLVKGSGGGVGQDTATRTSSPQQRVVIRAPGPSAALPPNHTESPPRRPLPHRTMSPSHVPMDWPQQPNPHTTAMPPAGRTTSPTSLGNRGGTESAQTRVMSKNSMLWGNRSNDVISGGPTVLSNSVVPPPSRTVSPPKQPTSTTGGAAGGNSNLLSTSRGRAHMPQQASRNILSWGQ